jgi:hypothetical protein
MCNVTPYEAATHLIQALGTSPGVVTVRTHFDGDDKLCLVVSIEPSLSAQMNVKPSHIDGYKVIYDIQDHPMMHTLH